MILMMWISIATILVYWSYLLHAHLQAHIKMLDIQLVLYYWITSFGAIYETMDKLWSPFWVF